jgi:hypothetical protein
LYVWVVNIEKIHKIDTYSLGFCCTYLLHTVIKVWVHCWLS